MNIFKKFGSNINISGNHGTVYINGKRYNLEDMNDEKDEEEFLLEKTFKASEISKIIVDVPTADISFTNSNDKKDIFVSANGTTKSKINIVQENNTLKITMDSVSQNTISRNGSVIINSNIGCNNFISIGNCNSSTSIKIQLPYLLLRQVDINVTSGSISFSNEIKTKNLSTNVVSADVTGSIVVDYININSVSGDIDLNVKSMNDLSVRSNSVSGDVNLKLENVCIKERNISTVSGIQNILHENSGNYNARLDISTISGDVTIQ